MEFTEDDALRAKATLIAKFLPEPYEKVGEVFRGLTRGRWHVEHKGNECTMTGSFKVLGCVVVMNCTFPHVKREGSDLNSFIGGVIRELSDRFIMEMFDICMTACDVKKDLGIHECSTTKH